MPLTFATWKGAQNLEYNYAAVIQNNQIISIAAVWRYSFEAWELAAVRTRVDYRRRGYSQSVCSFTTNYILASGKIATCTTMEDNEGMCRTAKSIGYYEVPSL